MVEQSGSERVDSRVETYIEELREFFTSRNVPFGSPQDIANFAEQVAAPGPFQEEMGSMVRSIQFREDEKLGRGELLEVIAAAVGGTASEDTAQEMHGSIRKIFGFVNDALRQRSWESPTELPEEGATPVTAGQILAATDARRGREERAVPGKVASNGIYRSTGPGEPAVAITERPLVGHAAPEGSGILFKAVSMSEEESAFPSYGKSDVPVTRRPWFLPAAVAAVVVAGALLYVKSMPTHHPAAPAVAADSTSQALAQPVSASACVAPSTVGSSRTGVDNRMRWAHGLLDQKMYDAALPELRQVAKLDPSYPGINLDQSNTLLQLKRPEDARDAVDAQIGISDCLAKLPGAALDAYCSAEFSPSTVGGCRGQLAHIRQAAELQAALVHLELGHRANPDAGMSEPALTAAPLPEITAKPLAPSRPAPVVPAHVAVARRAEPLPPATEGDNAGTVPSARTAAAARPATSAKPDRKASGDDALRRGEGTDSVYGAYSRPQD